MKCKQLRNIYQTLSDSELNYMHRQLLGLKEYSGQDGKWRNDTVSRQSANVAPGFRRSLSNRRLSSRQRQFNRRYGKTHFFKRRQTLNPP